MILSQQVFQAAGVVAWLRQAADRTHHVQSPGGAATRPSNPLLPAPVWTARERQAVRAQPTWRSKFLRKPKLAWSQKLHIVNLDEFAAVAVNCKLLEFVQGLAPESTAVHQE